MKRFEELMARSSLNDPRVRKLRSRAPDAAVKRILVSATKSDSRREVFTGAGHRGLDTNLCPAERTLHSSAEFAMFVTTGQFTIREVRPLGCGGLGAVDEVLIVNTNHAHPIGTRLTRKRLNAMWSQDPSSRVRFEREIQLLATMRHPNIVSVEGASVASGERYYVMPLYPVTLRRALRSRLFHRDPIAAVRLIVKIAETLAHAHSHGFIHRDLKPENILLTVDGEPIISDWGQGQFVHFRSKVLDLTCGGPLGSSHYCSLEQWSSGRSGVTGDIYSLGVILAELIAGIPAKIEPIGFGIREDVFAHMNPTITALGSIVRNMTKLNSGSRYQSMAEVVSILRDVTS